jgi:hypothetical protein
MFERYTEKTRRVIFFARGETSRCGTPHIETEPILLGILREHKRMAYCCPPAPRNPSTSRSQPGLGKPSAFQRASTSRSATNPNGYSHTPPKKANVWLIATLGLNPCF